MKTKYLAVYEVGANNLSGFLPDLPGVIATAANLDEMRVSMREAAEFQLRNLVDDGDAVPNPVTTSVDYPQENSEHGASSCIVEWLEISVPEPPY
jgi:predicted RNase H-like HicB family nuclease